VPVSSQRPPDPFGRSVEPRGHLDSYAAAIDRVLDALGKPRLLEPVDHPGDSASREPGLGGKLAGGEPATVLEASRKELVERGVEVSDVQEFPWGTFVFFKDPDGNGWALQALSHRQEG
jgi:hypothetical protein